MQRRDFIVLSSLSLLAAAAKVGEVRGSDLATIRMSSDRTGARVGFDPIGLFVEPGETVRWLNESGVHTVTAYHPENGSRPLRIPELAESWDSGYLVKSGETFERRFDVPGVYDYFCIPHEGAGMVGRLVVGHVSGPGAEIFGDFASRNPGDRWREIPDEAKANFPDPHQILCNGVVRAQTSHE